MNETNGFFCSKEGEGTETFTEQLVLSHVIYIGGLECDDIVSNIDSAALTQTKNSPPRRFSQRIKPGQAKLSQASPHWRVRYSHRTARCSCSCQRFGVDFELCQAELHLQQPRVISLTAGFWLYTGKCLKSLTRRFVALWSLVNSGPSPSELSLLDA